MESHSRMAGNIANLMENAFPVLGATIKSLKTGLSERRGRPFHFSLVLRGKS